MAYETGNLMYTNKNGRNSFLRFDFDKDNISIMIEKNDTIVLLLKKAEPESVNQLMTIIEKMKNCSGLEIKVKVLVKEELNNKLSAMKAPKQSFQFAGTRIEYSHGSWLTPDHRELPMNDTETHKATMKDALESIVNYRIAKIYSNPKMFDK